MRKTILMLGGSAQQVIAIETAKKLGYYTVLCDFLPDNPGQYVADKFYLESTTDKQATIMFAYIYVGMRIMHGFRHLARRESRLLVVV